MKSLEAKIREVRNEQRRLTIGTEEYIRKSLELKQLEGIYKAQLEAVNETASGWKTALTKISEYSNVVQGLQTVTSTLDGWIGKLKQLAQDAAALDDAYGQVMKTTGLTHDEVEKLNEAFKKMDTRTSREQLNELAYEAGKLGITGVKDVAAFVDASDKINVALGDVLGDGAMVQIGKMAQVYAKSTDELAAATGDLNKQMLAIGSAVNELGKISTANEGYLVNFAGRMGGIAVQAGLSADQVLGFASALDQDMQKVEMSATAFQKFIGQIMKKPEEFAKQAGMAVSDFSQLVRTDLNEALFRVLQGFSGKGGYAELVNIFKDLGLDGARAATVISSMASSIDKIRVAQAAANEQLKSGHSIVGEYETMNNTMQAQAEKAKKRFEEIRIELGDELYPVLISLTKTSTAGMKGLAQVVQLLKEYPGIIWGLAAALAAWQRAKILQIATDGKLLAGASKLLGIDKLRNAQTAINTAREQRRAAAMERRRLEEVKSRLATAQHIATDKSYCYTLDGLTMRTKAQSDAVKLQRMATTQATIAEQAHARSVQATKAALMSTPWGLIITAITSIAVGVAKIVKNSNSSKLRQTMREVARETASAKAEVDYLFNNLRKAKKGTEEYAKALEALKSQYPDLLKNFINEKGELYDIEKAYNAVAEAAKKSIYERVKAEKLQEAAADTGEKVYKQTERIRESYDHLAKKLGKENVARRVWGDIEAEIKKLEKGEATASQVFQNIKKIQDEAGLYKVDENGNRFYGNNRLIIHLQEIEEAYRKYHDLTQTYSRDLGVTNEEDKDPFGIGGMDVAKMDARLKKVQKWIADNHEMIERYGKDKDLLAKYRQEEQALLAAIAASRKEDSTEPTSTGDGGFTDKEIEKWEKVSDAAKALIADFAAKEQSGLAKIEADIALKVDAMKKRIGEAVGATAEQKEVLKKNLEEAAASLRAVKVGQYLEQSNKKIEQLKKQLKSKEENEYLSKAQEALVRLQQQFDEIDRAIALLDADRENATDAERRRINALIAEYRKLKGEMVGTALGGAIDTSEFGKPLTSKRDSEGWSASVKEKVSNAANSTVGMIGLYDKSQLEAYGNELAKIEEREAKRRRELEEQKAAQEAIAESLEKQGREAIDSGDLDLAHSLAEQQVQHEENAKAIDEEIKKLSALSAEAEQMAATNALGEAIDKWIDGIETFGNAATEIWGNVNTILDNQGERERIAAEKRKDEAVKNLDEQLEEGIISQEEYNERKQELEDEYDEHAKQIALEQWKRQKALQLGQAVIESALAVLKAWNAAPWPYNAVPIALATAMGAMQIAAIASEPEPYAKGGYVPRRTVYQAGESGEEWVASNSLLQDPATAPLIAALEQYQRGGRLEIPMAQLNEPIAMQAARTIASRQVAVRELPPQTPSAWERASSATGQTGADEMVSLMRDLAAYLRDPRNRQAVISRRTMQDFDREEEFLRSRARL